ncbi:MAG: NAD(P)/FAD-dependent oxidoreductase [Pseudomonadales bacterium]|nr:NAD(P)/FAD-dependent oxidoreductase [Pseudomonadales bacterium]
MGEQQSKNSNNDFDVIVVGAGFGGMYMLHKLREQGFSAKVIEAGDGVGGTWYWNRYPGARCDIESLDYQFGFSDEIQRGWSWTERFSAQPEILRYAQWVSEKLDLLKDIQFKTRVIQTNFNEQKNNWSIETDTGETYTGKYCVMATGCLSMPRAPDFDGLDSFKGNVYFTAQWPHEEVDFSGQTVAVIGTGSSGIQSIPIFASQADHVTVFQRTPNFSLPAYNKPLEAGAAEAHKDKFMALRREAREVGVGFGNAAEAKPAAQYNKEEAASHLEEVWKVGGLGVLSAFSDMVLSNESNDVAAEFIRDKIRGMVDDPVIAEKLAPKSYPLGTKRPCVDTGYFDVYNRDNVSLIDINDDAIESITATGIKTAGNEYTVDNIVFATGFDAMTGALLKMDIRGRDGYTLNQKWEEGARTYLGLSMAGFPNLFTVTGPGSPSVLSNMIVSIEQHVEWIVDCLKHMRENNIDSIEADTQAESDWVAHVNQLADLTLFPQANSWYIGANIPGKPRVFMPYIGGVGAYAQKCNQVAADGYDGFKFSEVS